MPEVNACFFRDVFKLRNPPGLTDGSFQPRRRWRRYVVPRLSRRERG